MPLSLTRSQTTHCYQQSTGEGSRVPHPGSLTVPTWASSLVKLSIPFHEVVDWPPRPLPRTVTCLGEERTMKQSFGAKHIQTTLI